MQRLALSHLRRCEDWAEGFQAWKPATPRRCGPWPPQQAGPLVLVITSILVRQGACIRFLLLSKVDLVEDSMCQMHMISMAILHTSKQLGADRRLARFRIEVLPPSDVFKTSIYLCSLCSCQQEANAPAGSVLVDPVFWMATAVMNKNSMLPAGWHIVPGCFQTSPSYDLLGGLLSFPVFQISPRSSEGPGTLRCPPT